MTYTRHAADLEFVSELSFHNLETAVVVVSPDADLAGELKSLWKICGLSSEARKRRGAGLCLDVQSA